MQKLLTMMDQVYQKIPVKVIKLLYCTSFSLVLVYDYNFLTRFDREPFKILYIAGAALAGIVLIIRFLNMKNEKRSYIIVSAILLLIGGGYFLVRHSYYFLVLAVMMVGAQRIKAKKLIVLYLLVASVFFTVMVTHFIYTHGYATGSWVSDKWVNFGSINSTDCQGMLFFILVAFLFVREKQIGFAELTALTGLVLWFWSHTNAELNMYCSLACLLIAACMKTALALNDGQSLHKRNWPGYIISVAYVALAATMIILSIKFDPSSEKWEQLNLLLHKRLTSPHARFLEYPQNVW